VKNEAVLLCVMLAPVFAGGSASAAAADRAADEQAIVKAHDEWFKAFDALDADATGRIETDDFTVATEAGVIPKDRHMAGIRRRREAGPGKASGRKSDNRQFHFYGDTALVTQNDHYPDGREFQDTMVWVRSGQSWKVAHLHYTLMAKKP
jgi:ketosteroid isomerase-like protein